MKKVLLVLVVLLSAVLLVSCAPKDQKAAKEKMEGKGYDVAVDSVAIPAALNFMGVQGIETVLVCSKTVENSDGDSEVLAVTAIYFDTKDNAKKFYEEVSKYAKKNAANNESKITGHWIYYGSEKAMKDFA